MGRSEVFQAQVLKNFFDTITGTDRNLTRIYMCVITLAKLRNEPPEKVGFLIEQLRRSRESRELSIDILDYMCSVANSLDMKSVLTAYGVKEVGEAAEDFLGVSLDSL
ncbi:hypothetical protein [Methanothrix sp.]|uniref:hypothetical protein n=1 Tax=Methanothrix sp. TaxID=90426 RepID=UPI0034E24B99